MSAKRIIFQICLVFIIIGALNWGLVALSPTNDIILSIFPNTMIIRSLLYAIIGLSGIVASYIWISYPSDVCT
jgi:uncharacterized membrane protein YuzA (DUF378 family)